jgi:hypothetical protein
VGSIKNLERNFIYVPGSTSGELGIRTPGPVTVNSFQDCRNRPLCQLSGAKVRLEPFLPKLFRELFAPDLCLLLPRGPSIQQ